MKVLITGAAGFIGFHTVNRFLKEKYEVIGLDNINDYYSPQLKYARLKEAGIAKEDIKWYRLTQSVSNPNYRFVRMNLEDKQQLFSLFQSENFDYVVNLAAQAGVRYSIENPDVYIQSNIIGFYNIIEACRNYQIKHLVHASSSSVYGDSITIPFTEEDKTDAPESLYAATKKSNELIAYTYSKLYHIPVTCLRFFTVYGPWGRPDMAPMLFASAITNGKSINIFNNGEMERDFTYVSDIVEGVFLATLKKINVNPTFLILNIGNGKPVNLMKFISVLESCFRKEAPKIMMPMQKGDVPRTWANQTKFIERVDYIPQVDLSEGLKYFAQWYENTYILLRLD